MKIRPLLPAALCLMVFPAMSHAQEGGQVGLTMGFPTGAGVIWHATGRIAVRPEITFSQVTSRAELTLPNASTETSNRALGVGASLLWYFGSSDGNVRPYLSPRIVYNRSTSDDSRSSPDDDDEEPVGSLEVSGSLGVQYTPSRRFGVFGEVGFSREHTERTRSFPDLTVTTSVTSWSTRSAVGVILYFGG